MMKMLVVILVIHWSLSEIGGDDDDVGDSEDTTEHDVSADE